jgi:DNA polymerase I-like protein with 3'-5' exonuclease and polymerase domains
MPSKEKYNLFCFDTETELNNQEANSKIVVGNFPANPWHPDNYITYLGYSFTKETSETHTIDNIGRSNSNLIDVTIKDAKKRHCVFVGHNIKFDLEYLLSESHMSYNDMMSIDIWDTAYAEYILSGFVEKFPSLDSVSERHGLPVKNSAIKDYWNKGVNTSAIPKSEIIPYLKQDVENTKAIALVQLEECKKRGILPVVNTMMRSLLMTTLMEYNGTHIDRTMLYNATKSAKTRETVLNTKLNKILMNVFEDNFNKSPHAVHKEYEFANVADASSNQFTSSILFGGQPIYIIVDDIVIDKNGDPVIYKTGSKAGEMKTKKTKVAIDITTPLLNFALTGANLHKLRVNPLTNLTASGHVKLDADMLNDIKNTLTLSVRTNSFIKMFLDWKEINKEITTYLIPFHDNCWPDSKVRGNIQHTGTGTGRMSSSNPNMLNISNKDTDDESD